MSNYRGTLKKQVKKLQKRKAAPSATAEGVATLRKRIANEPGGILGLLTKPLPKMQALSDKLMRAQITTPAKVFVLRGIVVAIAACGLFALLGKNPLIGFFLGIAVGLWIPLKLVDMKLNKQHKQFLKVFPDGIDLIVRGLRSGLPVSESFKMVATEVPEPVGGVFKNITDTMQLGVPMEKALVEVARGMNSTEFNFFTTSIILQRETGGNLGEILSNLSEVLRKRYMMQMKIKAMTSEARASAMIVGALPPLVTLATMVMSPGYMDPMWSDYRGNYALGGAFLMLFSGVSIMRRMAKFEI